MEKCKFFQNEFHESFRLRFLGSYRYSPCALKQIDSDNLEAYIREGNLLLRASFHPNICRFYGIYENTGTNEMYLVMDYYPNGSIKDVMEHRSFQECEKLAMCKQLAIGVYHLKSE